MVMLVHCWSFWFWAAHCGLWYDLHEAGYWETIIILHNYPNTNIPRVTKSNVDICNSEFRGLDDQCNEMSQFIAMKIHTSISSTCPDKKYISYCIHTNF